MTGNYRITTILLGRNYGVVFCLVEPGGIEPPTSTMPL